MANILRLETGFPKIENHVVESRFWAGVEERNAVVRFERGRGDNFRMTELSRIKYV
jgi:hypothetical protein